METSKVVPISRNKNSTTIGDFRPISILPSLAKRELEKVVKLQISAYLGTNNFLNDNQSAYRSSHSTCTALLNIIHDLMQGLDDDPLNILVLFDFSEAFDNLNHSLL